MDFISNLVTNVSQKLGLRQRPSSFPSPIPDYQIIDDPGIRNHIWRDQLNEEYYKNKKPTPQKTVSPMPTTAPKVQPKRQLPKINPIRKVEAASDVKLSELAKKIERGLKKYQQKAGKTVPIATMSAELAEAGRDLPQPLLPTLLALIETSGGVNQTRGRNNIYNMLANDTRYLPGGGLNYPDLKTAILGGYNPEYDIDSKGLRGVIMEDAPYKDYLQSGNLVDFLSDFTPPADKNADMSTQVKRFDDLAKWYFE